VSELAGAETCVGPVNDVSEALADPHVLHRAMVAEIEGTPVGPGLAIKLWGEGRGSLAPPPALGQHTDEVLERFGFAASEIGDLRARGVF
jgi:crotonobetainyl-CoA:carnitine CoA-transferase CaiB-like acyl-CoA transferase